MTKDRIKCRILTTDEDQSIMDAWWSEAENDDSVYPWLSTGIVPNPFRLLDPVDGFYARSVDGNGVIKMFVEPEMQTAMMGIWVLTPQSREIFKRGDIATALLIHALKHLRRPDVRFIRSYTVETNQHGCNFSSRMLGESWGTERDSYYDQHLGRWVGRCHYRANINAVIRNAVNEYKERGFDTTPETKLYELDNPYGEVL